MILITGLLELMAIIFAAILLLNLLLMVLQLAWNVVLLVLYFPIVWIMTGSIKEAWRRTDDHAAC